jgi:N-acetyl sugar amidotransferase
MAVSTIPDPSVNNVVEHSVSPAYRQCVRCVMDNIACSATFDEDGVCNYCRDFGERVASLRFGESRAMERDRIVVDIKRLGIGQRYDCVIGMSGGVDSTYVAYLVRRVYGLRPLAVHLDNGWNSETAVHNIERAVKKLEIDLHTKVLDWSEFRELQLAFLRASVSDAEIPTDHAIFSTVYETARKHRLKYVVDGLNVATEGIFPREWTYGTWDWRYIKDVNRRYGSRRLRTFPHRRMGRVLLDQARQSFRHFSPLNYQVYDKAEAIRTLGRELGWEYYGGKHYESIYTRFFQGYILPVKFGIDKRKSHLSAMICTGQINRDEALKQLAAPTYDEQLLQSDREFVIKKLGLTNDSFEELMRRPIRSYRDHSTNAWFLRKEEVGQVLRRCGLLKRRGVFHI